MIPCREQMPRNSSAGKCAQTDNTLPSRAIQPTARAWCHGADSSAIKGWEPSLVHRLLHPLISAAASSIIADVCHVSAVAVGKAHVSAVAVATALPIFAG